MYIIHRSDDQLNYYIILIFLILSIYNEKEKDLGCVFGKLHVFTQKTSFWKIVNKSHLHLEFLMIW